VVSHPKKRPLPDSVGRHPLWGACSWLCGGGGCSFPPISVISHWTKVGRALPISLPSVGHFPKSSAGCNESSCLWEGSSVWFRCPRRTQNGFWHLSKEADNWRLGGAPESCSQIFRFGEILRRLWHRKLPGKGARSIPVFLEHAKI
jgi:hypothetical protein